MFCLLVTQLPCREQKHWCRKPCSCASVCAHTCMCVCVCVCWKNTTYRHTTPWSPLFLQLLANPINTRWKREEGVSSPRLTPTFSLSHPPSQPHAGREIFDLFCVLFFPCDEWCMNFSFRSVEDNDISKQ